MRRHATLPIHREGNGHEIRETQAGFALSRPHITTLPTLSLCALQSHQRTNRQKDGDTMTPIKAATSAHPAVTSHHTGHGFLDTLLHGFAWRTGGDVASAVFHVAPGLVIGPRYCIKWNVRSTQYVTTCAVRMTPPCHSRPRSSVVRSHSECAKETAAQVSSLSDLSAIQLREPARGSQKWRVDRFCAFEARVSAMH